MYRNTALIVALGLASVVGAHQGSLSSARADSSDRTGLSNERSDIWDKLETICSTLKAAGYTQKKAIDYAREWDKAMPIVAYCYQGIYPDFMVAAEDTRAIYFEAAQAALPQDYNGAMLTTGITTNGVVPALGGIGDSLVRGLASVLVQHAKAELQQYLTDTISNGICGNAKIKAYIEYTCGYLQGASNSLGIALGAAFRAAIVADVVALPDRVLASVPAGTGTGLSARAVFTIAVSLVERADLKVLATKLASLAARTECSEADSACLRIKRGIARCAQALNVAVEIAGAFKAAEDKNPGGLPPDTLPRLATLAKSGLEKLWSTAAAPVVISDAQAAELRDRVLAAMASARAWLKESGEKRRETAGAMLRAVAAVIDSAFVLASDLDETAMSSILRMSSDIGALVEAIGSADLASVFNLTLAQLAKLTLPEGFDDVRRVLALGVELSAVKTADEASAVLEAVAAPMGGYRRKRFAPARTVTGLVGGGLSLDVVRDEPTASTAGLVGLVGADLTWPLGGAVPGVFVSVLDLGAVFTDKATEGSSASTSIALEQLVALGLHARLATRWTGPLVLHAGAAWVPNYREVGGTQVDVVRLLVGISVDVSLLPF